MRNINKRSVNGKPSVCKFEHLFTGNNIIIKPSNMQVNDMQGRLGCR